MMRFLGFGNLKDLGPQAVPNAGLLEFDPSIRSIAVNMRAVTLRFPYLRFLVGVREVIPGERYEWTGHLWMFGSTEPFAGLDQPVFAMPFPNLTREGTMACGMSPTPKPQEDPVELVKHVVDIFFTSGFTWWVSEFPLRHGGAIRSLEGLKGLCRSQGFGALPKNRRLSDLMTV